jgi:thioesterase domain-containing protein
LEVEIAAVWQGLLKCKSIGPDDDFFELGGDSLLATQMLLELERYIGQPLPIEILLGNATIRQLADSLLQKHSAKPQNVLVQLQRGSDEIPFIYTSGVFPHGEYYVNNLAKLLGPNRSFYFLRSHGSLGNYIPSIRQMAQNYKQALVAAGISGPYRLGGHCNGALIALELARQLEAEGHTVELVAMVESLSLNARPSMRLVARTFQTILKFAVRDTNKREAIIDAAMSRVWRIVRSVFLRSEPRQSLFGSLVWRAGRKTKKVLADSRGESKSNDKPSSLAPELRGRNWWSAKEDLVEFYHQRMAGYIPMPVAAPVLYVISESSSRTVEFCGDPWRNFMPHHEVVVVPGDHNSCVTTQAEALTDHLRERLMALDRGRVTDVRCG